MLRGLLITLRILQHTRINFMLDVRYFSGVEEMPGVSDVTNGHTNGVKMQPEFVGSRDIINRVEFTRLLEQSLCDLGYPRWGAC